MFREVHFGNKEGDRVSSSAEIQSETIVCREFGIRKRTKTGPIGPVLLGPIGPSRFKCRQCPPYVRGPGGTRGSWTSSHPVALAWQNIADTFRDPLGGHVGRPQTRKRKRRLRLYP